MSEKSDYVQVLIPTMGLEDPSRLLGKMNINTSFVIGNQIDNDSKEQYYWRGNSGLIISRSEKGVGFNRNITIKYATAKYCVIADDDMCFHDNYHEVVVNSFKQNPKADVLIFNIDEETSTSRRINKKKKRVGLLNYMNYGAARIVFRRSAISYYGISFNSNFGGGTVHAAGEDSLFLRDCLLHGLKIVAVPESLARLTSERESTWFKGYNKKYLYDKGVFLGIAHPSLSYIFAVYLSIRHPEYKTETKSTIRTIKEIFKGIMFVKKGFHDS